MDDNRPLPKRAVQTNPYSTWSSAGRDTRRSRPMVGRQRRPEGSRMMMRKTSLLLLGAAAGGAVTLGATSPRIVLDGAPPQAAAARTYRQVSPFGDDFATGPAGNGGQADHRQLGQAAITGQLA